MTGSSPDSFEEFRHHSIQSKIDHNDNHAPFDLFHLDCLDCRKELSGLMSFKNSKVILRLVKEN